MPAQSTQPPAPRSPSKLEDVSSSSPQEDEENRVSGSPPHTATDHDSDDEADVRMDDEGAASDSNASDGSDAEEESAEESGQTPGRGTLESDHASPSQPQTGKKTLAHGARKYTVSSSESSLDSDLDDEMDVVCINPADPEEVDDEDDDEEDDHAAASPMDAEGHGVLGATSGKQAKIGTGATSPQASPSEAAASTPSSSAGHSSKKPSSEEKRLSVARRRRRQRYRAARRKKQGDVVQPNAQAASSENRRRAPNGGEKKESAAGASVTWPAVVGPTTEARSPPIAETTGGPSAAHSLIQGPRRTASTGSVGLRRRLGLVYPQGQRPHSAKARVSAAKTADMTGKAPPPARRKLGESQSSQ